MNVLLITLDQFRGDCLSAAGHPLVRTPHLDRLAADGVRFARHYSQAAPCAPGRACLYTGTYQMNNRVVGNGTPLDRRFDNVALAARRAGYDPTLFGYTDAGLDPREADGPDDPRLRSYEEVLPGFQVGADLRGMDAEPWIEWLADRGYAIAGADPFARIETALASEPERPVDASLSAFTVDRLLEWVGRQDDQWFAHLSLLRPHPPYAAPGDWSRAYDPADVGLPIAPADDRHWLHDVAMRHPASAAPTDEAGMRHLRAQYFGMIGHVDEQVGRLRRALEDMGAWDDTVIVVTADHGEQLGDHGLIQKLGYFEQSYHILLIVRDPRRAAGQGTVVTEFTENVDIFPTLCELMGVDAPVQCDGLPLTLWLDGERPPWWRSAAHWEFDWRTMVGAQNGWPWARTPERQNLAVLRTEDVGYVQFGDGSWRCFDLRTDPTWRTWTEDPAIVLDAAQQMLLWRSEHADRTLTGYVIGAGT